MGNELITTSDPGYPMTAPADDSSLRNRSGGVARFLVCLKTFWWIPLVALALGLAAGVKYASHLQPVFVSQASMWETMKLRLPEESLYSDNMDTFLGTQIELLQSEKLQEMARDQMKSQKNGDAGIPTGKDAPPSKVVVRVNLAPKSSILNLQATGFDPVFTRNYLDALMDAFLSYEREMRNQISGVTLASINDQMQSAEQDLKSEQDALMAFEQSNNMAILQEQGSVAGTYLEKLQTQLSDLTLEAKLLEAAGTNDQPVATETTNAVIPWDLAGGTAQGPDRQDLNSAANLEQMKMERAEQAKHLAAHSPKIEELDDEIRRAEEFQEINQRQNTSRLAARRQANQIRMDYVQTSIKEWQDKVTEANGRLAKAEQLKLNIQRSQSVFDHLAAMAQSLGISRSIDQESLAILEPASVPLPFNQGRVKSIEVAALGGLATGMLLVFLIGLRDDRFKSVSDVNMVLGDAVVGMLPRVKFNKARGLPLLAPNDSRYAYAESYRSLRSALHFFDGGEVRPKVLLITSATPNEGKSTVSANLAHTLAMSGSRVLLVDGDLRKGHLHHLLGLQNEAGLTELLSGTREPEQVIQTNSIPNLKFISRGIINGNPGDLMLSTRVDGLLDRWRREFDYVLIDSSPMLAAADASCLAPRVDGTLFLVRSHFSSARVTREALEVLVRRHAKLFGVVFNMAEPSGRSSYNYKYADYYYPPAKRA
jgi:capsular exopolysaccharide synthesis family protein